MLDPPSLDAIVELLFIFLMPPFFFFFYNHFTLLDPWKYFNFVGTKELSHFARIRKLFHQGITQIFLEPRNYSILLEPWLEPRNYSASLKSRSYSIFVGFVSGTKELLSFLLESRISFGIKDFLSFARIKDLLNFTFLESRIS